MLSSCFDITEEYKHLLAALNNSSTASVNYDILKLEMEVSFVEGHIINASDNANGAFNDLFPANDLTDLSGWYFTDGSKTDDLPFSGFAAVSYKTKAIVKGRTSAITSICSCEILAIIAQ